MWHCGCRSQRTTCRNGFSLSIIWILGIELRTLILASKFLGRPSHLAGHKLVKKAKRVLGAERALRSRSPKGCSKRLCERKLRNPGWRSVEGAATAATLESGCTVAKYSVGWRGKRQDHGQASNQRDRRTAIPVGHFNSRD